MVDNRLDILGDGRFQIHDKDGFIWVMHPKWSVIGSGKNLQEALISLFCCARSVLKDFLDEDEKNLSKEAIKFRRWLSVFDGMGRSEFDEVAQMIEYEMWK